MEERVNQEEEFNSFSLNDYYSFIARWKDAYPYGLPLDAIPKVETAVSRNRENNHRISSKDNMQVDIGSVSFKKANQSSVENSTFFHPRFSDNPRRIIFLAQHCSDATHHANLDPVDFRLDAAETILLSNAVKLGLKLEPTTDVALIVLKGQDMDEPSIILEEYISKYSELDWVMLGIYSKQIKLKIKNTILGNKPNLDYIKPARFVETISLGRVVDDPSLKRKFWEAINKL